MKQVVLSAARIGMGNQDMEMTKILWFWFVVVFWNTHCVQMSAYKYEKLWKLMEIWSMTSLGLHAGKSEQQIYLTVMNKKGGKLDRLMLNFRPQD